MLVAMYMDSIAHAACARCMQAPTGAIHAHAQPHMGAS